jgi:hypothetical protein
MKAEERKALETNTLAKELNKAIDTFKQGPSRSTTIYLILGVSVVLAALLFRYFWRSSEATAAQRWLALDEIVFPEQLSAFLAKSDVADTVQGRMARFKEARLKLSQGIRDFGSDPSLSQKYIDEGTALYEKLVESAGRVPLLHQEALWGAAKGNEAKGDLDKAKKFYERLAKEYPASSLGKDAKAQLERLDSSAGQRDIAELMKTFAPPK